MSEWTTSSRLKIRLRQIIRGELPINYWKPRVRTLVVVNSELSVG